MFLNDVGVSDDAFMRLCVYEGGLFSVTSQRDDVVYIYIYIIVYIYIYNIILYYIFGGRILGSSVKALCV